MLNNLLYSENRYTENLIIIYTVNLVVEIILRKSRCT